MAESGRKRGVRLAMSVAAVGVATSVVGVAATQPSSISTSPVDLAALIIAGSSTNWDAAGVVDYFHGKFNDPIYTGPNGDDITYVNFLAGPLGIKAALEAHAGEHNAVIAGGWGAANVGLLLALQDPAFQDTVVVMIGDVARPDGGFGTRYPLFSLIGVNPIPTPSQVNAVAAVNTGVEYDYNSNAPADFLNPIAAVNALAAYLTARGAQAELDLPVYVDGTPSVKCDANTCAILASGAVLDCADARCSSPEDRITAYVTTRNNTTYVTYTADELPLTGLIRQFLGDRIANIANPLLKLAVDSAYYGGNPIPTDPSAYRPARLFPSPADLLGTLAKIPGAIQETLAAATAAPESRKSRTPETVELSTVERKAPSDETIEDTSKPLTNVVRDSVKAIPGQVSDDAAAATTVSERVEPEDSSDSPPTTDPSLTDLSDVDTDTDATDTDADTSSDSGDAAAA
jgi:PE-PPE domain